MRSYTFCDALYWLVNCFFFRHLQKPLYRMPIEETGRPSIVPVETSSVAVSTPSSSTVASSSTSREQPSAQLPEGMSVSEWLAQDERVIRTHDLLAGAVDSAASQQQQGRQGAVDGNSSKSILQAGISSLRDVAPNGAVSSSAQTRKSQPTAKTASQARRQDTAVRQMTVPKSAYQLFSDLRRLAGDQDRLYQYVKVRGTRRVHASSIDSVTRTTVTVHFSRLLGTCTPSHVKDENTAEACIVLPAWQAFGEQGHL